MIIATRVFLALLVASALVAGIASCGSTVAGGAQPAEIDVRTLDVGQYPVDPLDIHADYPPTFLTARQLGGVRLADHVASAYDVDPHLSIGLKGESFIPGSMTERLGNTEAMQAVAKRYRMLFGFESAGSDHSTGLYGGDWPAPLQHRTTVIDFMTMQFPDPAAADRAAADFYAADFGAAAGRNQPAAIDKYPAAHAHWRPGVAALRSYLAHGAYVVGLLVETATVNPADLTALAQRAYDTQLPMLDSYPPMAEEDMLRISRDPDYLLARTLNSAKRGDPTYGDVNIDFGVRAMLNYAEHRDSAQRNIATVGADQFARTDDAEVIRVSDPVAARKAVTDHLTDGTPVGPPAAPPPKVPDSACFARPEATTPGELSLRTTKRFTCMVAYRRYVAYLRSDQLTDAQQRTAAQYALLANSQWET